MFKGISPDRCSAMTEQERPWFDNVKKAFHESDTRYAKGRPQDCMEPMCKAIDVAKTLRRSLLGQDTSHAQNKARFVEFVNLEVPSPQAGGLNVPLRDARTRQVADHSFAAIVYSIRCMVHENENLDVADQPDYHILLDWNTHPQSRQSLAYVSGTQHDPSVQFINSFSGLLGTVSEGRIVLNGHSMWGRIREIMGKFTTAIDGMIAMRRADGSFSITIHPPLGSIRPSRQ
jgi:hypothetical protein